MGSSPSTNIIRKPNFDGRFYPQDKKQLLRELELLFKNAEKPVEKKPPIAIISPHAGYIFSGEVAASAINQIPEGKEYKRVFVIASSHHMFYKGASVYCDGDYETPLGIIKVDRQLAKALVKGNNIFNKNSEAHNLEHSLEVQLPFLQFKLGSGFKLVPIILGTQSDKECEGLAKALTPYFNEDNLFIISSDFSHYPEYNDAVKIDKLTSDAILTNVPSELLKTKKENKKRGINNLATSLCGWTSVLTLMYITQGRNFEYKKILYQNSGDITLYGDKNKVVGYQAIAVYARDEDEFYLNENEKKYLLELSRHSLEKHFGINSGCGIIESYNSGKLNNKLGAFVSLYNKKELRGCIGVIFNDSPLVNLIKRISVSAAMDRRFDKVTSEEVEKLTIEISVLTPLKRIYSKDKIKLGTHGIYIQQGLNSGTFLPQVATKTGWSVEEFLGHCSKDKAGLGWEGWKSAELYTYEAIIFKEDKNTA